jgi:3-phosphoshikimate 1-carboxyvinyltransferase
LLTPLAAALGGGITFIKPENDKGCSLGALLQVIHGFGLTVEKTENGFTLCGKATPHEYLVGSGVDAYGLAGLLLSLPLLGEGAGIRVIGGVLPDLAVVQRIMKLFGVEIAWKDGLLTATGTYAPRTAAADGDWFAALNWLVGGVIGGILRVENLHEEGEDIFAIEWLEYIGGILDKRPGAVRSTHGRLRSGKFDASRRADIVPILAVAASFARGTSVFTVNPALYKEYGKVLSGTADMIRELGGVARDDGNILRVRGVPLRGGEVDAKGDCRIAMAAAIAASRALNPVTIRGAECVLEQYPTFFDDYRAVNGRITIE